MTRKNREAIRRLIKGDHLTSVHRSANKSSSEEYFIGYNGNSPLQVDTSIARHLIRLEYVEGVAASDYHHEEEEVDYILTTKSDRCSYVLQEITKYSLGDTVEYNHEHYGKGKGVITKELDPIGSSVILNGIQNRQYNVFQYVVGLTRMVLIEKVIKEREVNNEKLIAKFKTELVAREDEAGYMGYIDNDEYYDYRDFYDDEYYY